ncbi:hypothetical protein B7486_59795 [cyanobacterium TDX16]|nr:hypothetical protein B7486_59795 [cyanobacterium TDX16]
MAKPRRRRAEAQAPQRLILDSGAIIALARDDDRARAVLASAWEAGIDVVIPAVVLAETVRGNERDAAVNRVIKAVDDVREVDASIGRLAGALLGESASKETLDALVVAVALAAGGGVVLTSDPADLRRLAAGRDELLVQAL